MKRTALTLLLTAVATVCAHAQTAYDAWLFSENNYEGTARSVAMGNAFTALGGDLGAVSINPAGSAVAGYSQMTITPSLTFSTNTAVGVPYEEGTNPYFQNKMRSSMTRFGLPNVGFSFNFNTGRNSGLKAFTFGFAINRTNSWCEDTYAKGINSETSFLAAAAADAQANLEWYTLNKAPGEPDFTNQDLLASDAYDYMPWKDIVGYRSGMFSAINEEGTKFAGSTELVYSNGDHQLVGILSQAYGRKVTGNKYEYILNFGGNISDFLYIGLNLGMNTIDYNYSHYFKEKPYSEYGDFENIFADQNGVEHVTYFKDATYKYNYSAEGTGVFAKLGFIVAPGNGLRFGAAIQTPTSTTINEEWQESAETNFTDPSFDGSETSEVGAYSYTFKAPMRTNVGAAYTFGNFGVISADYEMAAYGRMKYKINRNDMYDEDIEYFENLNEEIAETYRASHYLRLGLEIKPTRAWAVRAGYNLATSPLVDEKVCRHNVSLGVGFSSKKSFFADFAARYTLPQNEYIIPYSDYLADVNGALPPEILNVHRNLKVMLTLGWRF